MNNLSEEAENYDYIKASETYFNCFNNHDYQSLSNMYVDNIILTDWTGKWTSKADVIKMNIDLFNQDIKVQIQEIYAINNRTYNHIEVHINNEIIKVIDVIDWTDDFMIEQISAYKG